MADALLTYHRRPYLLPHLLFAQVEDLVLALDTACPALGCQMHVTVNATVKRSIQGLS